VEEISFAAENVTAAPPVEALDPSPDQLDQGRVIDAETDVGSLWVERDAELMAPSLIEHGYWAEEVTGLMRNALRPGMTFVDAGANVGYFSVLGSKLVGPTGRVFCIEVDPGNVEILRANLWRNGCANARVLPVAAWSETTELTLRVNPSGGAGSSVGFSTPQDATVPAFRLDEVISGQVDYMKVDCESTDHLVVSGAEGLIRRNPSMLTTVEFNPDHTSHTGHSPQQILDIYRRLDLSPYRIEPGGVLRPTSFEALARSGTGDGQTIFDFALSGRLPLRLRGRYWANRLGQARYRTLKAAGDLLDHVPERIRPPIRTRDRHP
jgi:FkbM family methyltransferase